MPERRPRLVVLRWRPARDHRCAACGRWIGLGAEAGHGYGLTWCEPCHIAADLRRADRRRAA